MEKIYVGTITGAFGIKGELKVLSNFEMPEKVFKKNNKIYLNDEIHLITNVRFHKNRYLIEIDNLKDINLVNQFRNLDIYFLYEELDLAENEYLLQDLMNLEVYDEEELVGKVSHIILDKINPLIKVDNKFYIPLGAEFIKEVDVTNKKIICTRLKELML